MIEDDRLKILFEIQEACPEAMIASGLTLGVEILLREFKVMKLQNGGLKELLKQTIQDHLGGHSPCNCVEISKVLQAESTVKLVDPAQKLGLAASLCSRCGGLFGKCGCSLADR